MDQIADKSVDQGIQVIARAAQILRVLRDDTSGLSLGQIARRVELPRSTVQRIVNSLISERLVLAASAGGGLRLGPEIQSLAAASRMDIVEQLHPILVKLSGEAGETVDLSVFRNGRMIFLDQVTGSHRLRTVSSVGDSFPLTTTANGKSALSLLDASAARHLIDQELAATGLMINTEALLEEIRIIGKRGYAEDNNEHTDGISAVGAAFLDTQNSIYAISIPVPTSRFAKKMPALTEALKKTVQNLRL